MAKTSDEVRQAKYRAKFKENKKAYQAYLEKDRIQKKLQKQRDKTKKSAIAVSNTQKLHYVRVHNSKQLYVSSVSSDNNFLLIGIFKGVFSNEGKEESVQDSPTATRNLNVNLGDWIVVNYDGQKFPGEVTK